MKCLIIYNPKSGRQNVVKKIDYIVSVLKQKYDIVDKKASFYDGETRDIARESCGKYDLLVVAGGDGTIHEVVCGIAPCDKKPRLAIIPAGTINDVSRSLKIPRNLEKCLKIILKGEFVKHDLLKINDEYGIYGAALGLLTEISYKVNSAPKRKFGKFAYYFSIPRFIFGKRSFDMTLKTENGELSKKASLFLVLNSHFLAGRKVDKMNRLDDGKVQIVVFGCKKEKVRFCDLWKIVMFFAFGMKKKSKSYDMISSSKFSIHLENPKDLNIDGEKIKDENYEIEVLSPGIEIVC